MLVSTTGITDDSTESCTMVISVPARLSRPTAVNPTSLPESGRCTLAELLGDAKHGHVHAEAGNLAPVAE